MMAILTRAEILAEFDANDQPTATKWQDVMSSFVLVSGGLRLLAEDVTVNLASSSAQTLYTVPAGLTAVPLAVVLRAPTATAAAGVVDLLNFATGFNLTNLNATTRSVILMPALGSTPGGFTAALAAASTFQLQMSTTVASVTAKADVIGYELLV